MRRLFFFFLAVSFVMRGFVGDAMSVTMAYDSLMLPTASTATVMGKAASAPSCHDMEQSPEVAKDKADSTNHADHCQSCCAVIAIPTAVFLTFDPDAFFARPVAFNASLASNDLLPAYKPPIF